MRGVFSSELGENDHFAIRKGPAELRVTQLRRGDGTVEVTWQSLPGARRVVQWLNGRFCLMR